MDRGREKERERRRLKELTVERRGDRVGIELSRGGG